MQRLRMGRGSKELMAREACRSLLPFNQIGVENRAFNASALIVPGAVVLLYLGYASETDTNAAGHRRFERNLTGNIELGGDLADRFHHQFGTAADDLRICWSLGNYLFE